MTSSAIQKQVTDVCTSNADDLAYLALGDLTSISGDLAEYRVIGGHMVNLLRLTFQATDAIERRTSDADAAISLQIAADGRMHERLLGLGYTAESGNRYVFQGRTIDLLIPSGTADFTSDVQGERRFDAVPGLLLDPEAPHFEVAVTVTYTNKDDGTYTVRIPTVERAVIMKSYALASRGAAKDLVDLYNLLLIAREHDPEEIGGWGLGASELKATRLDAARILSTQLRSPVTRRLLEGSGVSQARVLALATSLIPAITTLHKLR